MDSILNEEAYYQRIKFQYPQYEEGGGSGIEAEEMNQFSFIPR